uniref:alcohol oxidase n=1 Tax=Schwanniomyces vanrijiae TaxID=27305 RepID=A9ZSZ0_9ASCO|nr:formate oxidase 3 [Schwanniomyces vanrijiae]
MVQSHYDFIIVGGGTAGNTVAGRLAENPDVSILVVEAGVANSSELPEITTPSNAMNLRSSKHDWAYKTTLVKRDDYERIEKPNTRGKALGGSSSLNYFTWIPGCKPTFDRWAEYGGKEWTWDPLVPYLRKSVTYHDDAGLYNPELKKVGGGGPIPISHSELVNELKPFRDNLIKAWKSTGKPLTENIYDGEMIGLNHCISTIYHGKRSGSYLFLQNTPNVTIIPEVHSKTLIIDASHTAKGVVVIDKEGNEHSFYATREVIVSQGVFESPKLLMLSGIGPRKELESNGIEVKVESRHVGQNLLDHPGVPFVLQVKDGVCADDILMRPTAQNKAAIAQYQKDGSGAVGSGLLEIVGFPRIDEYFEKDPLYRERKAANGGKDPFSPEGQPHFELDFVGMYGTAFQWHFPTPKKGSHITVVVDLVRPVSDPGEVTLNSADPLEEPKINLNFFADDLDIVGMREGIRFSYDVLTKGTGFKDLVVKEFPWEMPLDDEKEMKRAVLDRCQTAFHPCGTNRLSKNIEQGVVDPALKVHGVKHLRVIDASIIPIIPDCRIQNSVYMIGEKGADLIKADHKDLYK